NHARQDYHWADTYARALYGSQLLNMLNTRYIVVDAQIPPDRLDHQQIARTYEEVYRDELAIVYENPRAFPRAWIVHDVRPNNDGEGLALLADGSIDSHFVAFVDGPIPPVTVPPEQNRQASVPGEQVVVTASAPESLTLQATAVTDGLLVVSASYANGWNAYVDGERVELLRTNHALQGVSLPAGEHEVELRYEPAELTTGLRITGVASVAMLGIWSWALVDHRRQHPAPDAPRSPRRSGGTFRNPIRRRSRS
ncbi:MAG: YfhO family protein, partial [Chloroflexia bacterium]|nr:YfhO family protein [Chloroflexia bacterium]